MVKRESRKMVLLVLVILILWAVYLAVCSAPVGAPFIYAEL